MARYTVVEAKNIHELILKVNNDYPEYDLIYIKQIGIIRTKIIGVLKYKSD